MNTKLIITFLAAASFMVGCKKDETAGQQLDKAVAKTEAVVQDMKDYPYTQKSEFTTKMQAQLAELKVELDALEAKIEKSSDSVKAEARPKLKALREQEAQLNVQLDEAKNATESTWEGVKAGSRKAYDSLKQGFQESRQWVSDKIAP
ncbi:MAG: hypothetical protein K0Q55_1904 [Verrucomicrobia bacterium]|jgi:chromosome segregation ATPase|nr:hypothetical protein [Verrucomicrobiota bacterium]